jgi:hypothetical protein
MTTGGSLAPIAVAVTAITTIGITVTIPVEARNTAATVTITAVTIVPIAVATTVVRIAVGGTTMSHILARGRSMRPIGDRVVNANSAAVQVLTYRYKNSRKGEYSSN